MACFDLTQGNPVLVRLLSKACVRTFELPTQAKVSACNGSEEFVSDVSDQNLKRTHLLKVLTWPAMTEADQGAGGSVSFRSDTSDTSLQNHSAATYLLVLDAPFHLTRI